MAKNISDDEIDFKDISNIKTPEQFSLAAQAATEKLLELDKPQNLEGDYIAPKEKEDGAADTEADDKPPAPEEEQNNESTAEESKVDDDLLELSEEVQKAVMAERKRASETIKAAEKKAEDASKAAETIKAESEGKRAETLRMSEMNQDKAGFAQVMNVSKEIADKISQKRKEHIEAMEDGDTNKAADILDELLDLKLQKRDVDAYEVMYEQKYGKNEKGEINFRVLEPATQKPSKTEDNKTTQSSDSQQRDQVNQPAPQLAYDWGNKNAEALKKGGEELYQSLQEISKAVGSLGLNPETAEFWDEVNRFAKRKHNIDLASVGDAKEAAPTKASEQPAKAELKDIPSTVAPVKRSAPQKSGEVTVTALQRQLYREAGGDPDDPVWLAKMAEENRKSAAKAKE